MNLTTPIILASNSPRRKELLNSIGITFDVLSPEIDETWPSDVKPIDVPEYLAKLKSEAIKSTGRTERILAADTVVILNENILGKPKSVDEAEAMLQSLSGNSHQVVTGVCMQNQEKVVLFKDVTQVTFKELTADEIRYYVSTFEPFDKAGSYGIQEWIGMIGVSQISGSFYNVMGLPVHKIYQALKAW